MFIGVAVSGFAGGAAAEFTGGDFKQGAMSAAIVYLFNDSQIDTGFIEGLNAIELVILDKNPALNTVVTDGKGGMMIQLGLDTASSDAPSILIEALILHEAQHMEDIYNHATNLDLLDNQPMGMLVGITSRSQRLIMERRAYRIEIGYLKSHPYNIEKIIKTHSGKNIESVLGNAILNKRRKDKLTKIYKNKYLGK